MASLKPIPFYVVFDGLPGPESCKFVETENKEGKGVGSAVTGGWSDHPIASNLKRLGPFILAPTTGPDEPSVEEFREEIERLKGRDLEHSLRLAINRHCAENVSNTSDVILAEYLIGCLKAFDQGVIRREKSSPIPVR